VHHLHARISENQADMNGSFALPIRSHAKTFLSAFQLIFGELFLWLEFPEASLRLVLDLRRLRKHKNKAQMVVARIEKQGILGRRSPIYCCLTGIPGTYL
jgi:hypothetical protein